jgi:hypothetical protein
MIVNDQSYCVCIATYSKRKDYIKNLIEDIRKQSQDIPIYISVNCDYKKQFDNEYRKYILELASKHENVYLTFYLKFRGLSRMWNDMITNTCYDNCIIINDDSAIKNNFISDFINHKISTNNETILKTNNGWACFIVNYKYINSVGFFNENYIGIGFEDAEFVRRTLEYPAYMTEDFVDLNIEALHTFPTCEDDNVTVKEYSSFNKHMINSGQIGGGIHFRPFEQQYIDNYDKIFG